MLADRRRFGFFPFSRREEVIRRVRDADVNRVANDFKDAGASEVKVKREEDGTWRITAIFD